MIKSILTAVAMTIVATSVQAQSPTCGKTLNIYSALIEDHGEERIWMGKTEGVLIELWGNDETQTWTLMSTTATGTSCIITVGQDYRRDPVGDPA